MPTASSSSTSASASTPVYDLDADGPTRNGPRKRRKITRSRLGCLTCRRRKKLCDMTHPVCGPCTRLAKECEWPSEASGSSNPRATPIPTLSHDDDTSALAASHFDDSTSTTVDDFTGIFGDIDSIPSGPTPNSSFLPVFSNTPLGGSSRSMAAGSNDIFGGRPLVSSAGHEIQQESWEGPSILEDLFNPTIDEATLQLWTTELGNANSLTLPQTSMYNPTHTIETSHVDPLLSFSPHTTYNEALLQYYRTTLLPLISCVDVTTSSTIDALTKLSDMDPTSLSSQGLRSAVLAWAGRHMANRGEVRYEVVSQRLEDEGKEQIMTRLREWEVRSSRIGDEWTETERLTLLAGVLTLFRIKECRGDVTSFVQYYAPVRSLTESLYPSGITVVPVDSIPFHIFEHLTLHDILSSFIIERGSWVNPDVLTALALPTQSTLQTLTGISFPLMPLMARVSALAHRRRAASGQTWDDDQHIDMVQAADDLQDELREEKKRLDALTKDKPHLSPHRFLHEAFRTACLLQLRGYVLSHTPSAIDIGLLVRQALSLLETMQEQKLPGICSTHWILFMTALHCIPSKNGKDERLRVMSLYQHLHEELGSLSITRSKRIVQEVWARNQNGQVLVDWMDIVEEWTWELFFV